MPLHTPDKPRSPFASVPNGSSPCGLAAILKKASTPPKRAASTPPKRAATPPRRATTPDATTPPRSRRKTPRSSRGTQTPPRSADAAAGASTPPRSRRRTPRSSRSAKATPPPSRASDVDALRHVDLEADDAFACLLHDAVTSARKKAASAKSARASARRRMRPLREDADVDAWPEMPLPASPTRAPDDDDAPAPTRAPDDDDAPAAPEPEPAPDARPPAAPDADAAPAEAAPSLAGIAGEARARLSAAMVRLLNAASQDELKDVLAGIGVVRARRVVEARAERPFDDLDEALARLGLSKRQAENIVLANLQQILCFPA